MKTKIYVLCEPDGRIRYIGKTSHSLNNRFSQHLSDARLSKNTCYRLNWIRSVLKNGYLPLIRLIGEVNGDGNPEEIAWISYGRAEGWELVNVTDGGEGFSGYKLTDAVKKKMSISAQERKRLPCSEITKEKIRVAHLGMPNPNKGKPGRSQSEKTRIKISKAGLGRVVSEESRVKHRLVAKSYWRSDRSKGHREKIRILLKKIRADQFHAKQGL